MKKLRVHEAATFLELSGRTIRLYADAGFLPCEREDNNYRLFRLKDLVAFRNERRKYRERGEFLGLALFRLKQRGNAEVKGV